MAASIRCWYSSGGNGGRSLIRSRTKAGRGSEPTTEAGKKRPIELFSLPEFAGEFEVLLGIDLHILTRRIRVRHLNSAFNHLLEQMDQVSLFERGGFPEGFAGELAASFMKMLDQLVGSSRTEFCDAG